MARWTSAGSTLLVAATLLASPLATTAAPPAGDAEASAGAALFGDAGEAYAYLRGIIATGRMDKAKAEAASAAVSDASARDPSEARWVLGMSIAMYLTTDSAGARAAAEKGIALAPQNPEGHYLFGNACFGGIMDASTIDQMSLSGKGKKAYEKAVELDPGHVDAHIALFQFYLNAPGIAGGSFRKARQHAAEVGKVDGYAVQGALMLAHVEAKDEEWKAMDKALDAAEGAAATEEDKRSVAIMRARLLLREKKDPKAAMPSIQRVIDLGKTVAPKDMSGYILLGEAHRELKEYPAAISAYLRMLESEGPAPEDPSPTVRYGLGKAYEAVGENEKALAMLEDFLTKFPKDRRADDAKSTAKKIQRRLGRS